MIRAAASLGFDLIGYPRLVRLDPNVPAKTRGNAALAARFGHGTGGRTTVGQFPEGPVSAYARGRPLGPGERTRLIDEAWTAVLRSSSDDPAADPALVALDRALPAELYREAVSRYVPLSQVEARLQAAKAVVRVRDDRCGLVGASAALAWPGRRVTFELIAYRDGSRGGNREVDPDSVREVATDFPELFLCFDPRTRRLLVAPHTSCPILFGLRATRPDRLARAASKIRSEPVGRWLIFRTNQATGDHLVDRSISELRPYDAGRITGTVSRLPEVLPGGHVALALEADGTPALSARVFEPTKGLTAVARQLRPGDGVRLWGGRGVDATWRVEGIEVTRLGRDLRSGRSPVCPRCGRTARSMGRGRGYRCPSCRNRFPPEAARANFVSRTLSRGTYHPTPSARRHLHPRGPEPAAPAR